MNTPVVTQIKAITSACTTHTSGEFFCLLDADVSNPTAVRILDASVTFAAATTGLVLVCSDNMQKTGLDCVRRGVSSSDNYRTSILGTVRTIDSTTVGVSTGAESHWNYLARGQTFSSLEIHFFDKSGTKMDNTKITDFFIVLEFLY